MVREIILMRFGHPNVYRYGKHLGVEQDADHFARAAVLACRESYRDSFSDKNGALIQSKQKTLKEATEICANHITRYRSPGRNEYPLDAWLRYRRALVSKHISDLDTLSFSDFDKVVLGYEKSQ